MTNNKDSRYDIKTEINATLFGSDYVATIRDNSTGKSYQGFGATPEKARDQAWRYVPKN